MAVALALAVQWGVAQGQNVDLVGWRDTPGDALGIVASGGFAYVADGASGLQIMDVSNPSSSPTLRATYNTPGYAWGVALSDGLAYVADGASGLQIIDVINPSSPTLRGSYNTPGSARGIAVSGGLAYVADEFSGLQILDVTDPSSPTLAGTLGTPSEALGIAVSGGSAYLADGPSGLLVVDVSNPSNPILRSVYNTPGWASDVTVVGGLAYVSDGPAGLRIVDISNPVSPQFRGSYDTPDWADFAVISGNAAYVADKSTGLLVLDVDNPSSPRLQGSFDTTGSAHGVAVSGGLIYVADLQDGLWVLRHNAATEDVLMPDAVVLVRGAMPGSTATLTAILGDATLGARRVGDYVVWKHPLSAFNPQPSAWNVDLYTTRVQLVFAISANGSFYFGAEGPTPDVLAVVGTFFWGGLQPNCWDSQACPSYWLHDDGILDPSDLGLVGMGWRELLDLQGRGYVQGIPAWQFGGVPGYDPLTVSDWHFRRPSGICAKHKLSKPLTMLYYPIFIYRGHEYGNVGVGAPMNARWCQFGSLFDNGTATRSVQLSYQGALASYVYATAMNNNGEQSWIRLDGAEVCRQTNWGMDARKRYNVYPATVELGAIKTWSHVNPAVTVTVLADSVTPSNWAESPSLGTRRNPPPDVLVLPPNVWIGEVNAPPNKPVNLAPAHGSTNMPLTPTLQASAFSDPNTTDTHAASQWQVRLVASPSDYSVTVFDSGETTVNLTSIMLGAGYLNYNTAYAWRVRYRDNRGAWSLYSTETRFTTIDGGIVNAPPSQPRNLWPPDGQAGVSLTPRLRASAFADPDIGDFQTQSQWQIRSAAGTYSPALYDSGTSASAVTEHVVPSAYLGGHAFYFWRVRYADSRGAWSPWSAETVFRTVSTGTLAIPEHLRAAGGARSVWLTWVLHNNSAVKGTNIYRSNSLTGQYILIRREQRGNEYLDPDLQPNQTYYYRATAVAANGMESPMTEPVWATVGATRIFMSNVRGEPGTTVSQMITIDNPNQIGNEAFAVNVLYEPTMLTPVAARKTVLTQPFQLVSDFGTSGLVQVGALAAAPAQIHGEGHVLEVLYRVNPASPMWTTSDLRFSEVELIDEFGLPVDIQSSTTARMTVGSPILLGDLTGDGRVRWEDVNRLYRIITRHITPTARDREAGDINGDTLLDSADLVLLMRMYFGAGLQQNFIEYPPPMLLAGNATTTAGHHLGWGQPTWSRAWDTGAFIVTVPLRIDNMRGIAGMDIVINTNPAHLRFLAATPGSAVPSSAVFDTIEENGQIRITFGNKEAATQGAGTVANLTFQKMGAWSQTLLIAAKFKASGQNGENLARTETVTVEDLILSGVSAGRKWWLYR